MTNKIIKTVQVGQEFWEARLFQGVRGHITLIGLGRTKAMAQLDLKRAIFENHPSRKKKSPV